MVKNRTGEYLVGLDVGTTKVCAVVGEPTDTGIDIVGIGTYDSAGLKNGVVVNMDATTHSIGQAVAEAERMAGIDVGSVHTGIAGSHIRGAVSEGTVSVRDGEITDDDVQRAIDSAVASSQPAVERQTIHVLTTDHVVDGQDGIKDPVGMAGTHLKVKVHIVTAASTYFLNLTRCVERNNLEVAEVVLQPLASATACLTDEEKDMGVCLVDIGGGTTDIIIYSEGAVVHTAVIGLGGGNMTKDIVAGLGVPSAEAEAIKRTHGCAIASRIRDDEQFEVVGVSGHPSRWVSRSMLCEILSPRVEELLQLVQREIQGCLPVEMLGAGVVLTGGSSLMPGIVEVAEEVIGRPARKGDPQGVGGLSDVVKSPMYATAVGLVLHAARQQQRPRQSWSRERLTERSLFQRIKELFGEMF